MGSYLNTYVGPILSCVKHEPMFISSTYVACSNKACSSYSKKKDKCGKFCSNCGFATSAFSGNPQEVDNPKKIDVSSGIFNAGLDEDALWLNPFLQIGSFDLYQPNKTPNFRRKVESASNFNLHLSHLFYDQFDAKEEIDWFQSTFAEYIQVISGFYKKTEVTWGFFNYYS